MGTSVWTLVSTSVAASQGGRDSEKEMADAEERAHTVKQEARDQRDAKFGFLS